MESSLQRSVKKFNHTVTLWVETSSSGRRNPQGTADSSADGGGELGPMVEHEDRGNTKPCNPDGEKKSDTGFSSDGA